MTAPLRVGVVGAGAIGRIHGLVCCESDDLVVAAIVDRSPESAQSLSAELVAHGSPRPRIHTSLTEALAEGGLDLIAICTPSGLHVDLALEAVRAGCHVIVEKPLDVRLDRARRLLAALDDLGDAQPVVSVISQHRFDPSSQITKGLVRDGAFGRMTSGLASVSWWRSQGYYDSAEWRGTWSMDGGGALMNQGIHTIDLLVWLMGEPVTVQATTALTGHRDIEVEDVAVATLAFEDGSIGVIHATTAAYPGLGTRLQLMGDAGSAVIEDDVLTYVHTRTAADVEAGPMGFDGESNQLSSHTARTNDADEHVDATASAQGHARQYANVIAAIRGEQALGMSVRDAVRSLAAVHATYVSSTLGKAVRFEDVLSGAYDDVDLHSVGLPLSRLAV